MHTPIQPDNPFGCNRYGFAWQHVPEGQGAHLDFGCGDGRFLAALARKKPRQLVGVDLSLAALKRAATRSGGLALIQIHDAAALPFADGQFESISALDVLEHVDAQELVLNELHRVLRDDGILIVTVPGHHTFSFLDLGNFKFRFPRLHRWYYCRTHSRTEYERRYVSNAEGLVGDVSATKQWHEHFSRRRLADLLERSGFSVVRFDGTGRFARLLKIATLLLGWVGPLRAGIAKLTAWDARRFESANLFCVACKCPTTVRHPQKDATRPLCAKL